MSRKLFPSLILMIALVSVAFNAHAQKLSSAYGALGGTYLPMWVTHEVGLFKKYGLDVELVFVRGGSMAATAIVAGQTPIAGADVGVIPLAGSGSDIVFIANMVDTLAYFLVARPEIKTKEDLRGKRAGISRFGSTSDFVTRMALEGLGLAPDRDVAIVQIGAVPDRFAAMEGNIVQATVLTPPINLVAKKKGFSIIVDVAALGLKIPNSALATTRSYMRRNREIVRKYLMAYLEGIKVLKSNPALSIRSLSRYTRVTDAESLQEAYKVYAGAVPERPYVDLPSIQKVIDFYKKDRPEMAKLKAEQIVDVSVLQEIDQSRFIDTLYGR
ncbi:MAG: ABC transporter substrate-binding protein [Deltaproteobacteria bacterium]|nr:ABC transporter substrate-binding protein [Deltaproteobacteria bacterium]